MFIDNVTLLVYGSKKTTSMANRNLLKQRLEELNIQEYMKIILPGVAPTNIPNIQYIQSKNVHWKASRPYKKIAYDFV